MKSTVTREGKSARLTRAARGGIPAPALPGPSPLDLAPLSAGGQRPEAGDGPKPPPARGTSACGPATAERRVPRGRAGSGRCAAGNGGRHRSGTRSLAPTAGEGPPLVFAVFFVYIHFRKHWPAASKVRSRFSVKSRERSGPGGSALPVLPLSRRSPGAARCRPAAPAKGTGGSSPLGLPGPGLPEAATGFSARTASRCGLRGGAEPRRVAPHRAEPRRAARPGTRSRGARPGGGVGGCPRSRVCAGPFAVSSPPRPRPRGPSPGEERVPPLRLLLFAMLTQSINSGTKGATSSQLC